MRVPAEIEKEAEEFAVEFYRRVTTKIAEAEREQQLSKLSKPERSLIELVEKARTFTSEKGIEKYIPRHIIEKVDSFLSDKLPVREYILPEIEFTRCRTKEEEEEREALYLEIRTKIKKERAIEIKDRLDELSKYMGERSFADFNHVTRKLRMKEDSNQESLEHDSLGHELLHSIRYQTINYIEMNKGYDAETRQRTRFMGELSVSRENLEETLKKIIAKSLEGKKSRREKTIEFLKSVIYRKKPKKDSKLEERYVEPETIEFFGLLASTVMKSVFEESKLEKMNIHPENFDSILDLVRESDSYFSSYPDRKYHEAISFYQDIIFDINLKRKFKEPSPFEDEEYMERYEQFKEIHEQFKTALPYLQMIIGLKIPEIKYILETFEAMEQSIEYYRENTKIDFERQKQENSWAHETGNSISFMFIAKKNDNQFKTGVSPYAVALIAIDKYKDELEKNWPKTFLIDGEEINNRYLKNIRTELDAMVERKR